MKRPEAVKKVGSIDDTRSVYIEDYALQYMKIYKDSDISEEAEIILYGSKKTDTGTETYIIYGACRQPKESGFFENYDAVGYLDLESWRHGEGYSSGIVMGNQNSGQPVGGYYVFYDADEDMKVCLSQCHEYDLRKNREYRDKGGAGETIDFPAELVALSDERRIEDISFYILIRMAVICILIIFCAIAVTTINNYDKLSDFVQTAVQTSEMMEEP